MKEINRNSSKSFKVVFKDIKLDPKFAHLSSLFCNQLKTKLKQWQNTERGKYWKITNRRFYGPVSAMSKHTFEWRSSYRLRLNIWTAECLRVGNDNKMMKIKSELWSLLSACDGAFERHANRVSFDEKNVQKLPKDPTNAWGDLTRVLFLFWISPECTRLWVFSEDFWLKRFRQMSHPTVGLKSLLSSLRTINGLTYKASLLCASGGLLKAMKVKC